MHEVQVMTVSEAFAEFASRLALTEEEEFSAECHRREAMMLLPNWFAIERSFYGGSFARGTVAKPILCADLFIELGYPNRAYRLRRPSALILAFRNILVMGFEPSRMTQWHGGLRIDYGPYRRPIQSINLVPILPEGDAWAIPDRHADQWLVTDPHYHDALVGSAHNEFPQRWRPLVQMIKCWNYESRMPVKPGFLLEVIGLEYFKSQSDSSYECLLYGLFEELARRLNAPSADPAGIAPAIDTVMTPKEREHAVEMVERARDTVYQAILAEVQGDIDGALTRYRQLFGPLFPVG